MEKTKMNSTNQRNGNWKRWGITSVMSAVVLIAGACSPQEPKEQAPADTNEPVLIAEVEAKDAEEVQLKETPVKVDYTKEAVDILAQYTEEGMSRFKLNYPDTFSMEYALKHVGMELPDFSGKTMGGKAFTTASLEGKPFVLNISKTTCPVCEEMSPIIETFGADESIPVISLYPVDKTADVKAFRTKMKVNNKAIAFVADTNDWLKEYTVGALHVAQVPTLIFVDENGRISYTYIGKTDNVLLKDMKEKAFGTEKLYDFVRTEVVKVDKDGNEVKEEPLVEEPASAPAPKVEPSAPAKTK